MHPGSAALHHHIIRALLEQGYPPSVAEIRDAFGWSDEETSRALRDLADDHGVVLHPGSDEIWVAHPFATSPTPFVVRTPDRQWWGNCAWCSLGVAALVDQDLEIVTTLGAETDQVALRIRDGEIVDGDYVVHFPIPMARAWDNVVYTCTMMLLFRDEAAVDDWCRRHRQPKGDVRPVEQVWAFSREWYGRHADRDWRKWTAEEAAALFARHGLDGPIWALPTSDGRF